MADISAASFAAVAIALFITELTDKDSLLLIAVSTKVRARVAFVAGATAFLLTTTIIVSIGSLIVTVVPVSWVRLAGGLVMIAYGAWEAKGLLGQSAVESEESRIERAGSTWRVFAALVTALALLDLAGDATEVLTVVLVAQYGAPLFVFAGVCTGLLSATAVETTLGNRLGKFLSPKRLRIGSAVVFLTLGVAIVLLGPIW